MEIAKKGYEELKIQFEQIESSYNKHKKECDNKQSLFLQLENQLINNMNQRNRK